MKQRNKLRYYQFLNKVLESHALYYFIFFIFIAIVYLDKYLGKLDLSDILDFTLITTVVMAYVVSKLSMLFTKRVKRKLEEDTKLSSDYKRILSKYSLENKTIKYENSSNSNYILGRKYTSAQREKEVKDNCDIYIFPITSEADSKICDVKIYDTQNKYALPDILSDNFNTIMEAHNHSSIYNQTTIRLDDIKLHDKQLELYTSRTTYYNTLVTNRAMDYRWTKYYSIRELFSPGPFLERLKDSKLSNHLGFNGFVETNDGKIIFIKRGKNTSVGKEALGASVSASLKAKYALNDSQELTDDGLKNAIIKEIYDELRIKEEDYKFKLSENIISLSRDVVEGGKPHLIFYIKANLTFSEIERNFKEGLKKIKKSNKEFIITDGQNLVSIDRKELKNLYITPDTIIQDKKSYTTMPTTSAALVTLIKHLDL